MPTKRINVIGAGLAGSEATNYLLNKGYEVHLYEARPFYVDGAHETKLFGELVCSNSLKSKLLTNACGLLKEEMRIMGSILVESAYQNEVPGGNALSVDREGFAKYIDAKLRKNPNLHIHNEEVSTLPEGYCIIATGPLTSKSLLDKLEEMLGSSSLSFFDASAPIVKKDSIDFNKAYFKSRYEQDDASYINCPFDDKQDYLHFVDELVNAKKALLHEFDCKYFESCLPIEIIASRGPQTLRHGPLKPLGLEKEDGYRPYAVVQLRQDDRLGDCYNLVGFQTNLTYGEQKRVFSLIPGLENAEFVRYGLMHRNSYIDSPKCLNKDLSIKGYEDVYVAGQLSGVEGYVESALMGILSAIFLDMKIKGKAINLPPEETVSRKLLDYITCPGRNRFEPMNANWALFPNVKKEDREKTIEKSLSLIKSYWASINE